VGKSGQELWRYLFRATGLTRDKVFVTNLVRTYAGEDCPPEPWEIRRDEIYLREELELHPNITDVITLGRFSTRWFLGRDVDMEVVNGFALQSFGLTSEIVIHPIYHPAAGLHNTEFQARIWWGFERLGDYLRGDVVLSGITDELLDPLYSEGRDGIDGTMDETAVDTEGTVLNPWGMSWSIVPGAASVVPAREIGGFQFCDRVIMHNAIHDLLVLQAMGIDISDDQFDDTMVMAYLLCVEPQGLKALAKRWCGMEMQDYDDVVGPTNKKLALEFMQRALAWADNRSSNGSSGSSPTRRSAKK